MAMNCGRRVSRFLRNIRLRLQRMSDRSDLSDRVNLAFEEAFSNSSLDADAKSWIRARCDEDTLRTVKEIIEFGANHTEIWVRNSSLATAIQQVALRVQAAYPELSPTALDKVLNLAACQWK